MSKNNIFFYCSILITISVITLLITGSSTLTIALDKSNTIPLGTFITWIGMVSLPLTIYFGIKEMRQPSKTINKLLSSTLKVIITLGILWVPLSFLLAGNLSFSFSEKETFQGGQVAMRLFWYLSYGIGIGAIAILFIYWISLLFKNKKATNY